MGVLGERAVTHVGARPAMVAAMRMEDMPGTDMDAAGKFQWHLLDVKSKNTDRGQRNVGRESRGRRKRRVRYSILVVIVGDDN